MRIVHKVYSLFPVPGTSPCQNRNAKHVSISLSTPASTQTDRQTDRHTDSAHITSASRDKHGEIQHGALRASLLATSRTVLYMDTACSHSQSAETRQFTPATLGSGPSDHYFRNVCLFVCLSVSLFVQSFSQPSLIRFRSNLDICYMSGSSCVP